ncbi:LysE family translocator [Aquimarina sp. D1M17]|uniref:LysE family translocator n=1 Tax=Aquimarina acroporae TaxID=2937283 RepID=UPI0020C03E1D|nr:LysE family translocator [Aquimarina acroporae]MCK8522708.1 LysE family translocator [Aquimarina acroporae]
MDIINYEILYTFALSTLILSLSPGPDNIFVLMQSMVNGKKNGLAVVLGLMTGCLIHTSLVAFGVSAIIEKSPTLFFIIKLFGALYLFFLAYKVYKSDAAIQLSENSLPDKSLGQLFRQGFMMNVLNPKVSIFFLAYFPLFLFSESMNKVAQFYVLGMIFILVSFVIFGSIAILAGTIAEYLKKNTKIGLVLKWLQILVFVAIGVFVLFSEK